jgi:hypothetical protein
MKLVENSQELLQKAQESDEPITVYKIILHHGYSPIYAHHKWKQGLNESNRDSITLTKQEEEKQQVHKGFHLLLHKPFQCKSKCTTLDMRFCPLSNLRRCIYMLDAKICRPQISKVLKCLVNPKDIVAFGEFNTLPAIVATKVEVLE